MNVIVAFLGGFLVGCGVTVAVSVGAMLYAADKASKEEWGKD